MTAAREEVNGTAVGAQPGRHAGDQVEGAPRRLAHRAAALAVGGPAAEPVRGVDTGRPTAPVVLAGSVVLAGQQPVGAALGEQRQPELVALGITVESGGHELQQPGPHRRPLPGEDGQNGPVGVPERGGCPDGGRGGDQIGEQIALRLRPGQPGGLDEHARVLRQRRVRRHTGRAALHRQLPELRPRLCRVQPPGEILHMLLERLDGQRPREGELQEHGALPLLVHVEGVHPFGLTGLAEEGRGVRGVVVPEEDPRGLLVEGGQEVRHRPPQPFAEGFEALLGGARTGLGLPRQPLDVLDQGQGVVPVGRVVDQGPGGEAQRLAADLPDLGGLRLPHEPQEVQGEVLGLAEGAGHQPDDPAVAERGMRVGAHGEGVGVLPAGAPRRQERPGVEQCRGGGLVADAGPGVDGRDAFARPRPVRRGGRCGRDLGGPVHGAHAARSSSSMSRPA